MEAREFPGGSVVRTPRSHCWGPGSIPRGGMYIPQAAQHSQEKKNKRKKKDKKMEANEESERPEPHTQGP